MIGSKALPAGSLIVLPGGRMSAPSVCAGYLCDSSFGEGA